jgi:hypothetical protein
MNRETFFLSLFVIWYISNFGYKGLWFFITKFYQKADRFIHYCNHMISPDIFLEDDDTTTKTEEQEKIVPKYEDKYLTDIRKMNKEFIWNDEEEKIKVNKYQEYKKQIEFSYQQKLETVKNALFELEEKIKESHTYDEEYYIYGEDTSDEQNISHDETGKVINNEYGETKEEIIKNLTDEKNKLNDQLSNLHDQIKTPDYQNEIIKRAEILAIQFMTDRILDKLKNCYIMETTPLGNVLMIYDIEKNTFVYYSDNTIPYRYLESVARKYVKIYNCRPIFVDMEEELKLAEEKWEKVRVEKEQKEEEEKRKAEELKIKNEPQENKKNVFAKFKSYNKDTTTSKTMAAPPKNSIPNKNLTKEQENEKVLLKERANRYRYEGKMSNFSFLKKVKRNVVDKKYAMTFSDFKRMRIK